MFRCVISMTMMYTTNMTAISRNLIPAASFRKTETEIKLSTPARKMYCGKSHERCIFPPPLRPFKVSSSNNVEERQQN